MSPHLTFRNNHRQVQIISPESFSLNCHCEERGGEQVELKDADHSLSGATAPVTKASQLVCWVCGLLIRCFCMDINRCLLSCCLRQRRSRYSEFAYVDISFCTKRNKKKEPCTPVGNICCRHFPVVLTVFIFLFFFLFVLQCWDTEGIAFI